MEGWFGRKEEGPTTKQGVPRTNLMSDAVAADEFAKNLGDALLYSDSSKRWFAKRNQVYEPTSPEVVQGMAKEFLQGEIAKAPERTRTRVGQAWRALALFRL